MENKMSNRKYEAVKKLDVANKKVVAIITYSILITILPLGWWWLISVK
jgi:hypothetical protein